MYIEWHHRASSTWSCLVDSFTSSFYAAIRPATQLKRQRAYAAAAAAGLGVARRLPTPILDLRLNALYRRRVLTPQGPIAFGLYLSFFFFSWAGIDPARPSGGNCTSATVILRAYTHTCLRLVGHVMNARVFRVCRAEPFRKMCNKISAGRCP